MVGKFVSFELVLMFAVLDVRVWSCVAISIQTTAGIASYGLLSINRFLDDLLML